MVHTNGQHHDAFSSNSHHTAEAFEQQRLHQRQELLALLEEAQTVYSPTASWRLLRQFLHRLPRWHTDSGLATVWHEQATELSEAEVEDLLSALLGDETPDDEHGRLLPQARYRTAGVVTLLAIARLRFPKLWALMKSKAREAGWKPRDLEELRGCPETFSYHRCEITQRPCGNETQGDRRERVGSA